MLESGLIIQCKDEAKIERRISRQGCFGHGDESFQSDEATEDIDREPLSRIGRQDPLTKR
jgi:hypothetical protein